jgi:hypothetical protein
MAIYHLRHASVGRSTHAAGTAGAHVSYITRSGACRKVIGEHMPIPAAGKRGGEARKWLDAQEEADRKNARVIDKVTIALPRELDEAQRVELVRTFAAEVTQGRVPWLAAIHDQGKDAENPHAHFVLRDRDLETGKMALRMSQKGSTEMLREKWEHACNAALERAGHEARIDRRTLEAQGIDREPTKHEGPIPRQIEAKGRESWKLEALRREEAARKAAREAAEAQREAEATRRAEEAATEAQSAPESAPTAPEAIQAPETPPEAPQEATEAAREAEAATLAKIEAEYQKKYEDRKWFDLRAYGGARLDVLPGNGGWQIELNLPRKRDFIPHSHLLSTGWDFGRLVSPAGPDFVKYRLAHPFKIGSGADVRNLLARAGFDLAKIPMTRLGDFESTPVVTPLDQQTWFATADVEPGPNDDPTRFNLWRRILLRHTNPLLDIQVQPHTIEELKEWHEAEPLPRTYRPRHLRDGLPDPSKWFTDLRKEADEAIKWCEEDTPEAFAEDGWGERIKKWVADHFTAAADLLRNREEARDRKEASRVQAAQAATPAPPQKPASEPDRSQTNPAPPSWRGPSM